MQSALGGWIKYTITAAIRKSQQYLYILIFHQKHCVFMVFFCRLLPPQKCLRSASELHPLYFIQGYIQGTGHFRARNRASSCAFGLRIVTFAPETGRLHVRLASGSSLLHQEQGVLMVFSVRKTHNTAFSWGVYGVMMRRVFSDLMRVE